MEIAEQKIIQSCQAGQLEQFGLLYDHYIKKIYDFIYYKTHHRQTAEDLTSQTFLKALKNIGRFDINIGTFSAWLYQIARHTVIDHYRASKSDINIDDVWDLSSDSYIERDTAAKVQLEKIEKYLKKFDSRQRDIIILRIWSGLSYREISQIVGASEASCKMSFSRGINKLQQENALITLLLFLSLIRYI